MILYKKTDTNQEYNDLGYEYIYKDKDNYVLMGVSYAKIPEDFDKIDMIEVREHDNAEVDIDILDDCYEIVHYGELKFYLGQIDIY